MISIDLASVMFITCNPYAGFIFNQSKCHLSALNSRGVEGVQTMIYTASVSIMAITCTPCTNSMQIYQIPPLENLVM